MDPNATKDRPSRLIVWLHPSGGYGNNLVEPMAPMFLRHGFALLVFTQKNTQGWSQPDLARAMKTVAEAGKPGTIDANRPILIGYSAGGQAALVQWFEKPGALGGLILDAAYPLDMQAYAQGRTAPAGPPKDAATKETPIFVAVGDQDGGAQFWRKVQGDWLGAGVPLVVHYVPGAKHQWLFNKAVTAELERWLTDVAAGKLPATAASQPATRTKD
jgi:predicted esterase